MSDRGRGYYDRGPPRGPQPGGQPRYPASGSQRDALEDPARPKSRQGSDARYGSGSRDRPREQQTERAMEPAKGYPERTRSPERTWGSSKEPRAPAASAAPLPPPPPRRTPVKMPSSSNPMLAELAKQVRLLKAKEAAKEAAEHAPAASDPSRRPSRAASEGLDDEDLEEGEEAPRKRDSRGTSRGPPGDEQDVRQGPTGNTGRGGEGGEARWRDKQDVEMADSDGGGGGGRSRRDKDGGDEAGPAGRKRRHPPIVWQPPGKAGKEGEHDDDDGDRSDEAPEPAPKQYKAGGDGGLLDRVQGEVLQYQQRMRQEGHGDVDLDAPPAMKASPSVSRSSSRGSAGGQAGADGPSSLVKQDDDGEGDSAQPVGGTSRWATKAASHNTDEDPEGIAEGLEDGGAGPTGAVSEAAKRAGGGGSPSDSSPSAVGSRSPGSQSPLSVPASPNVPQAMRNINMLSECRSVDEFERLNKVSEGTYGVVYRARDKRTGKICALKRVKMDKEHYGFPVTSIREINILLNFHHPNVVNVEEVVMGRGLDQVYMVMEFMDHDLKCLMEDKNKFARAFSVAEVKCLMIQLLEGVAYLHEQWVLHRDLKCANILYDNTGKLKICDFGMARQFGSPLRAYTHRVVTLWYRPPELLLGQTLYSTAVDVWSVGCIMAELLLGKPLFMGQGEMDQIQKIVTVMGTPTEAVWPGLKKLPNFNKVAMPQTQPALRTRFQASFGGGAVLSEAGLELLQQLLTYDPEKRMSARAALDHRWFAEAPLPQTRALMPTFKSSHDGSKGR